MVKDKTVVDQGTGEFEEWTDLIDRDGLI